MELHLVDTDQFHHIQPTRYQQSPQIGLVQARLIVEGDAIQAQEGQITQYHHMRPHLASEDIVTPLKVTLNLHMYQKTGRDHGRGNGQKTEIFDAVEGRAVPTSEEDTGLPNLAARELDAAQVWIRAELPKEDAQ